MPRNYTKEEHLSAEVLRRKHAGETNRQIVESYPLTAEQVKNLVTRRNRKIRLAERGYTLRRKGRPARKDAVELTTLRNECIELRMHAEALKQEKVTDGLVLHSDQGSQYASNVYSHLSQAYHFRPSMSSKGCPYDNSSMENFFGTLKSECLNRMKFTDTIQLEKAVEEYVHFYNYERITMKNGLTPFEIRSKAT
ncbi:MAG: IS3 family transposase [Pyramidobacter sp.]|nr:IS3 family transposase [Pyramidobacter sp.]